jgi:hypothetical protein
LCTLGPRPSGNRQVFSEKVSPGGPYRAAASAFAQTRPWHGTLAERKDKIRRLNRALAAAYGIAEPRLTFHGIEAGAFSGTSSYP